MKGLLAGLCGFALALAVFLSGAAVATLILNGTPAREPRLDMNQSELWTEQPRAVNPATQQFERVPARAGATDPQRAPEVAAARNEASEDVLSERSVIPPGNKTEEELSWESLDTMPTAAIRPKPDEGQTTASALPTAHDEWCANRYRSYRPSDNTYTPFSGGRRTCISPYMDPAMSPPEDVSSQPRDSFGEDVDDPSTQMSLSVDAYENPALTEEHVSYCFSRYRSYRPEDNSYQPYSGGPRRQCR
ncbi:BA14K family protein [Sinorhizobium fredii]|uniref:Lectin-like protein BA14k n=1 Tax=Rhizobium fredii TaxID=380 RepID=A0A2A6LN36_RHIFR|nr:BA14K family protein [Sinorhizobium fredii]PDT43730.1 BA14K family protein [Sinorhizobium fredii]